MAKKKLTAAVQIEAATKAENGKVKKQTSTDRFQSSAKMENEEKSANPIYSIIRNAEISATAKAKEIAIQAYNEAFTKYCDDEFKKLFYSRNENKETFEKVFYFAQQISGGFYYGFKILDDKSKNNIPVLTVNGKTFARYIATNKQESLRTAFAVWTQNKLQARKEEKEKEELKKITENREKQMFAASQLSIEDLQKLLAAKLAQ